MNARGKTTPSSTGGSFKPATGTRSRVTPDDAAGKPGRHTKGAAVTLTAPGWEGKTGTITRVKPGGLYHVRVPYYVGTIEFSHDELSAEPAADALTPEEQTAANWFAGVERSAVDTLTAAGMIPVGRNGLVDGEAVIRYRINGQLVDVCIEDYGDSSCPRVMPVNPDDKRSMSTQSDQDGTDLDTWLTANGVPGDTNEVALVAIDLAWAVGHAERAAGESAIRELRGF